MNGWVRHFPIHGYIQTITKASVVYGSPVGDASSPAPLPQPPVPKATTEPPPPPQPVQQETTTETTASAPPAPSPAPMSAPPALAAASSGSVGGSSAPAASRGSDASSSQGAPAASSSGGIAASSGPKGTDDDDALAASQGKKKSYLRSYGMPPTALVRRKGDLFHVSKTRLQQALQHALDVRFEKLRLLGLGDDAYLPWKETFACSEGLRNGYLGTGAARRKLEQASIRVQGVKVLAGLRHLVGSSPYCTVGQGSLPVCVSPVIPCRIAGVRIRSLD